MLEVLSAISAISTGLGSAFALAARRSPLRADLLENTAGAFLIMGFGLLGSVLPHLP